MSSGERGEETGREGRERQTCCPPLRRFLCISFFRHALDIREHYERKLERANNLYMELGAIMLQLEVREKDLMKYVKKVVL